MSLRLRLVLGLLAALLVALTIVDVLTYALVARSEVSQVDQGLERAHPPIERAASGTGNIDEAIRLAAPGFLVELREPDGRRLLTVPLQLPGIEPITLDDIEIPEPAGDLSDDEAVFTSVSSSNDDHLRLRISRQSDDRTLIIGQSLSTLSETRERLLAVLLGSTGGALLIAGVVGLLLIRVGLRPLVEVEQAAGEITDTELGRRVPGSDESTEVGRLALAINHMLDRIEDGFDQRADDLIALQDSESRMRQFVADASHELRTPIAATAAYAELFERGAKDHPDDLERAMRGIRSETTRMGDLVEDLLLLAQLDEDRPQAHDPVDLADVAADAASAAQLLAPDRQVSLHVEGAPIVSGDAGRLRQVVDNLLANVRIHTPPETRCSITVADRDGSALIIVADDGPGMDAADTRQAFDRFHRADPSRTRASGGAGLGLSIIQAIVRSHGGSVALESSPGRGTTVTIRLPLADPGGPR